MEQRLHYGINAVTLARAVPSIVKPHKICSHIETSAGIAARRPDTININANGGGGNQQNHLSRAAVSGPWSRIPSGPSSLLGSSPSYRDLQPRRSRDLCPLTGAPRKISDGIIEQVSMKREPRVGITS